MAREPQAYTLHPAVRALVRKGLGRIVAGRGVVLTLKGEQMLMKLSPEPVGQSLPRS